MYSASPDLNQFFIEKIIFAQYLSLELQYYQQIDLSSISYDGTNFYTFIDTFNSRCSLAKRGKNKQGRANLRQMSYALFYSADGQIPLFYDVYEGNRNDAKQFPIMVQKFHDFIKSNLKTEISTSKITLIFDKGNNSKDNFSLVDQLKLSYVGSVELGENMELTTIYPTAVPDLSLARYPVWRAQSPFV